MADNTQLSTNVGSGDVVRTEDRAGVKTQIVGLDLNPAVVPHEAVVVKGARWRVLPVAVAAGAVGAGVVELVGRVLA